MSTLDMPAGASGFSNTTRVLTFASLMGALVVTTLIAGELITVAAALIYSLVVLFHLSNAIAIGLSVVVGVPALWLIAVVARLALEAETDPANN